MTVHDLNPNTYGPVCKLVPFRGLAIKVEEFSAFGRRPYEVTVRAGCAHEATFLCHWRMVADELGFPHYEATPIALVCPPEMLKEVYQRGVEDGKREMADALLDSPSPVAAHGSER